MGKRILSSFLTIDARSLGLFRITMALVLCGDLFRRWPWVRAFYSNEGVLSNHNHIFNLRDKGQVWSFLHAFSSVGENHVAFALILLVYLGFLLGWKTRVFHALSLLGLVSLGSRNILLENQGNYAAVALLFFTLFLPLGSRFSVDALVRSYADRDEKTDADLNDRTRPTEADLAATRGPGWSPLSFAALAVTLQIVIILIASAAWHFAGPWRDGSGLYYALQVERWVSDLGVRFQHAPVGVLKGLSFLLLATECAVPLLVLVPVARRPLRGIAVGLLVVYSLALGALFSLGLYAWTLLAAAALLLPAESWDAFERRFSPERARSVVYDEDCGVCLWLARLARRLDAHHHLTFQGNGDLSGLLRGKADGSVEKADLPAGITEELVQNTIVVVDAKGTVFTRSRGIAEIVRALPFGQPLAFVMRLPGLSNLLDVFYDAFAKRRANISVLVGMDACGLPAPKDESDSEAAEALDVPSAVRAKRLLTGGLRDAFALVLFVAALAQAAKENPLPFSIPQGKVLAAAVAWPRMLERWDVLVVNVDEDGVFVIDGQNRKGASIDPLTGAPPAIDPAAFNTRKLGQLWNDYLNRVRQREYEPYQKALRDYLGKGGPALEGRSPDEQLSGYDAYWVKYAIAKPGESPARVEKGREKLFTHSRGGRLAIDRLPIIKPDVRRQE
ncbi:DCC1-like thiol-disulfide oxidoreductase family protein [Polyangium mundeleinium]|uniref:DCC1-like thiol-disulfide oxidoreductase family protein n=1 Tax=Polyangium mundeleinium TaxID=2995306 RepID=A0ABT5F610_9BACT|nr:DCC1-like thiol-disulfide oxidoreductase family protein [Polyangium mundeleinium]MDC0749539.1 DCC1-like thiol-disulfide oxidoreductase family protein [Polyangium mundeleinium]